MIVGMYLEYLWAADWPEIPPHCEQRSSLPWLDLCDCFHRYTFSHAMLRGQNLTIFAYVGACVAACFIAVENRRVRRLRSLLEARLRIVASPGNEARISEGAAAKRALLYLDLYSTLVACAFPGVLLLVPFNLERPLMHYVCTVAVVFMMLVGISCYVAMPLALAAGESHRADEAKLTPDEAELALWAKRHTALRQKAWIVFALHSILPATAAVHHFAWVDVTGRLFGACEVFAILSYQLFVALFASDDFAPGQVKQAAVTEELKQPFTPSTNKLVGG
eukprot:TRINITY_DN108298_c0_g1_i1.p1 TRINITY_DN108298_c0_g1~~TRINITY_DN108298_c0_g1_i1.p1  ORF type:complete len:321 (+),score=55.67 TRINITY_DN108298_c0_g1_i1:130-963(+)